MVAILTIFIFASSMGEASVAADDPWADSVLEFAQGSNPVSGPYSDASKAIGPPSGGGMYAANNNSLVCLGRPSGRLVLGFHTPITDDPLNPGGLDCIVFGNAIWVGGNAQLKWQEPCLIEISEDVNGNGIADDPWYLIPGSRSYRYPLFAITEPAGLSNSAANPYLLGGHIRNPNHLDADASNDTIEYNWGYGDMNPVMPPYLDNYVRPRDPFTVGYHPVADSTYTGGGDAFDIAWAVDADGNPANLQQFHFIRLAAFVDRNTGILGYVSPEIDGVADVAPLVDDDCDGILDEYETRVAGTDPMRRENTILPLEIPSMDGGSPADAILGAAADHMGTRLALYSSGERSDTLAKTVKVDITTPASFPEGVQPTGGLLLSGVIRRIDSSEPDFTSAAIQAAEVTVRYDSTAIAGLDETSLTPLRFDGATYSSDGITSVQVMPLVNTVVFRTRYAGVFVLAGQAGSGDTGDAPEPQGNIALTAEPSGPVMLGLLREITITGGPITDAEGNLVPDHTPVTVSSSLGQLVTPDIRSGLPGVQAGTIDGEITFVIRTSSQTGICHIEAESIHGTATGTLDITFLAGEPVAPIGWRVESISKDGGAVLSLVSTLITDLWQNPVEDGTVITITLGHATAVSEDADAEQPGFQVLVHSGRAAVTMEVASLPAVIVIASWADANMTRPLGQVTLTTESAPSREVWADYASGSDMNPGTFAAPVKTLSKAAGLVADGGTVFILADEPLASAVRLGEEPKTMRFEAAQGSVRIGDLSKHHHEPVSP